jgi:hypothetical protein
MYSLFAMLFKASYWRMLLRPDTWREAWLSVKRLHKDRRARRHVGQVLWLALIPLLCLAYLAWIIRLNMLIILPILVPIFWWQSRRNRQQEAVPSIVPTRNPVYRILSDEEQRKFREYFVDVTLLYAVMLDRAASETYLSEKVLPEGYEVTTRRTHLDLLKTNGLWERMDQRDREALMLPDGHWNSAAINLTIMGLEPLRLLRWMLRVDFYLPVIGQQLQLDYKLAHDLVRVPQKLIETKELVTLAMMEKGKLAAEYFYNRCVAERIVRGYVEASNEESMKTAQEVATSFGGNQHEDFVLGDKLVSEASREQLEWATMLSRRRAGFFHWTMLAMESGSPPSPPYKFQP